MNMTRMYHLRTVAVVCSLLALAAVPASTATPRPNFIDVWRAMYPGSLSDDNVEQGTGSTCQMCHKRTSGGDGFNGYGWRIRGLLHSGSDIGSALTEAGLSDSDLDPTQSTNSEEIDASTQPGWTDGPNNTVYYSDGSTNSGASPPPGILGLMDPLEPGTSYCSVNANSTGSPALMSAVGSTSIAANDLTLTAAPVPDQPFIFFFAPNQIEVPFGNGFLCVGGGITRLNPPTIATGNVATRVVDLPSEVGAAGTQNFQCWFRDPAGGGAFYNTSDGYSITFVQ